MAVPGYADDPEAQVPVNPMKPLHGEILRTLLYYDIWRYPLTARELFVFLPVPLASLEEFLDNVRRDGVGQDVSVEGSYYFVRGRSPALVAERREKEQHAKRLWARARISMHIIKRFPFVRGIFVSGDLSKNATNRDSDVDFFVVTERNRLWIARTPLILFKKVFLLNKKKYFCLNSFASSDHLCLDEQNIFLATEVAHLKPLYNSDLFFEYLEANSWIKRFFPNFSIRDLPLPRANNHRSRLQRVFEIPFSWIPSDRLDTFLLHKMKTVWARRYPEYDDETRERIFRCTKHESRAYAGNFEDKVLALYDSKLREFGVSNDQDLCCRPPGAIARRDACKDLQATDSSANA